MLNLFAPYLKDTKYIEGKKYSFCEWQQTTKKPAFNTDNSCSYLIYSSQQLDYIPEFSV